MLSSVPPSKLGNRPPHSRFNNRHPRYRFSNRNLRRQCMTVGAEVERLGLPNRPHGARGTTLWPNSNHSMKCTMIQSATRLQRESRLRYVTSSQRSCSDLQTGLCADYVPKPVTMVRGTEIP